MVKERFYKTEVVPRCLTFKRPAGTSRGVYTTRKLWEVRIRKEDEPSAFGIGECAPLPDLSCDYGVDYEITLSKACLDLEQKGHCAITHPSFSDWKWPCVIMNRVVGGITTRPSREGRRVSPLTD